MSASYSIADKCHSIVIIIHPSFRLSFRPSVYQECELDGFTVLNALLSCGFRLQRVNRVRLLRAVEELGGKMDYRDLCQVLLNSCADWTVDEKHVVQKILKSMGVTVIERRNWLAKLRQTLHEASARMARKTGRWFAAEVGSNTSNLSHGTSSDEQTMGITPATFLHCLRDCGIALNVDEEATLLDCLDTERLAKLGQLELEQGAGKSKGFGSDSWSIPTVEYESFLQFCARHCGSWVDAAPQIHDALQRTMESISNPILAVHEFASLLHAFDEVNIGSVSKRAFQICCHRSRLLANLPDDISNSLADILTVDGGGKVEYTSFIIYLRTLCSRISDSSSASPDVPSIINQLIRNATDSKGTLLPLRNWMIRHCDMESFMMTMKDLNALLREFSVMYRPQDLEALVMDIGQVVVQSRSIMKDKSQKSEKNMSSTSSQPTKHQVVDARDLMIHILKSRPRWTTNHPYLCKRMLNAMKTSGNSQLGAPISNGGGSLQHMDGNDRSYDSNGNYYEKKGSVNGTRGIETAVARRILTRLRAFTGRSSANIGAVDHDTKARDELNLMVERDIFKHLAAVTGLPLSDEDVLVLADATDFLPEATRIRCDVILDVLLMDHSKHSGDGDGDGDGVDDSRAVVIDVNTIGRPLKVQQSESGLFALDHLKDLLWRNATRLHRTNLEWIADVRTVFAGFDKGGNGLISSEDFTMALWLLNSTVSHDILQDISYIPEGRGLVDYAEILKYILVPPKSKTGLEIHTKSNHSGDSKHGGGTTDRSASRGKDAAPLSAKEHSKSNKDSPVELLVNVVRRSIHRFIVSDHTLETAWVCLLKAFQRFDPQETNQVTPRDFCLAVSVLLDGDDIVLTKSEWATIIDHFVTLDEGTDKNDKMKKTRQMNFLGGAMVDYMLFCEVVLNPAEVKSRLTDSRGAGKAETRIDRGKKFLSKSVNKKDTFDDRGDNEGSAAPLSLQGTSTLPSSSRNKASSSSSASNRGLQISPEEDEIVRRFRDIATSSGKSELFLSDAPSGGGRLGYNNAGASVDAYQSEKSNGPHKKSAWNTDELYRTVRTKEQANHASARGKTVSLSSARDNYASSHSNRGTTAKPSTRFNWTK
jgi:Ca2+-binding EF-hand superfamily protein